jgi:hypothetical protein
MATNVFGDQTQNSGISSQAFSASVLECPICSSALAISAKRKGAEAEAQEYAEASAQTLQLAI